jgi:polyphosphate kinase 2 (PPK2 family)
MPGLCQLQLPRQAVRNLLEGKPGEAVLQIAIDSEGLANTVSPILPELLDLIVMLLEERRRVVIVDQASDHAGHASVMQKVTQVISWPLRKQRLLSYLSGDVTAM